jgi:hypothetical protein
MLIFMRETYATTILERRASRLRKETGNLELRSRMKSNLSPRALFVQSIIRPAKMLIFSPIVFLLSTFAAVGYGYIYLLFTTFPIVFKEQYGFSNGIVGLAYIGMGVGTIIGVVIIGVTSDRLMKKKSVDGVVKPEYRLANMMYGAPCIPIGLFWYGWSAKADVHWIVPIIGTLFVGLGVIFIFVSLSSQPPSGLKLTSSTLSYRLKRIWSMPSQSMLPLLWPPIL